MRRAEAGVTDTISKPSPSIMRLISSPTLRRAATIRASATVPAEIGISVSVSRTLMQASASASPSSDRHQRRSIDGDHRGRPSGPNRKSWLLAALSPGRALRPRMPVPLQAASCVPRVPRRLRPAPDAPPPGRAWSARSLLPLRRGGSIPSAAPWRWSLQPASLTRFWPDDQCTWTNLWSMSIQAVA